MIKLLRVYYYIIERKLNDEKNDSCFPVCPDDAIPVNKDGKREDFNYDYCKGCGVCSKVCPFGAIEMQK